MTLLGAAALFLLVLVFLDALVRPLYGRWDKGERRGLELRLQVAQLALEQADPELAHELEEEEES